MNFFIFAIFCSIAAVAFAVTTFKAGTQLNANNQLGSPNQEFRLNMQSDGNLVVYTVSNGNYKWSTDTVGSGAIIAKMQHDGQFCLLNKTRKIVWTSNTFHAESVCKLQNDGNLVVFNLEGIPVWNATTDGGI
jgi:hypothetical protein